MWLIWKGQGWWLYVILFLAAVILWPFEARFKTLPLNADMLGATCVAGLSALATLVVAYLLERRDRAADKSLDARSAQAMHTLYWISLTNWGYILALLASTLFMLTMVSVGGTTI